jgi:predicted RNA-binding protein with PUA-like domain
MLYWLVKSEPSTFSISDLKKLGKTNWDGVRNYQARNNLRSMKKGDQVLFYHSVTEPIGIVGIAKVLKEAFPDPLQFEKNSQYFDAASSKDNPRWSCCELAFLKEFKQVIGLAQLKTHKVLSNMPLLQKGSRLSVQPVTEKEFQYIIGLVG